MLKIKRFLLTTPEVEIKNVDFTLFLTISNTMYNKGRKYERYYADPEDSTDILVKKT